jgi:hypothetical protein
MAKRAQSRPTQQRGLGPTQRALIGGALPGLLGMMLPGQIRLSSREAQPRPLVPPKGRKGK